MKSALYRTLFVGRLIQESALSVGGTDDVFATVDQLFCRDGRKRPTLRGTGLAGAAVATLRRLGIPPPPNISGGGASVWRFFNSHPHAWQSEQRQNVAINELTAAPDDGALFNAETLPWGVSWSFLLEVDTARAPNADGLARAVLAEWEKGRCWIGRDVARGLGWLRLEELQVFQLTAAEIDDWPQAEQSADYAGYIARRFAHCRRAVAAAEVQPKRLLEIRGRVLAGERSDGYGIDSLSVGSHAGEVLLARWDDRFLAPDGMDRAKLEKSFDPDFAIATVPHNGARVPFIPGSSLRGPLRHALARLLRARSPSGETQELLESLFGVVRDSAEVNGQPVIRSGKLLFRDAMPIGDCTLAWLQMHAEDEFTGGVFESAKFDRVAVIEGGFAWRIVAEEPTETEEQLLRDLFELAQSGQVAIGGAKWRGHGWLRWQVDEWGGD